MRAGSVTFSYPYFQKIYINPKARRLFGLLNTRVAGWNCGLRRSPKWPGSRQKKVRSKILKSAIFELHKCYSPQKKATNKSTFRFEIKLGILLWKSWKKFDFVILMINLVYSKEVSVYNNLLHSVSKYLCKCNIRTTYEHVLIFHII